MELREAIEELRKAGSVPWDKDELWNTSPKEREAIATIMNSVTNGTLIPADAVFQVKDGYGVVADDPMGLSVPLSEALTIRSADDVRREGYLEGHNDGYRAALSRPHPKGGGMMSEDLIAKLRQRELRVAFGSDRLMTEAADEITRLRARLEQAERQRAHWRLTALMSRREGFRAGIEAAAQVVFREYWGNSDGHMRRVYEDIRALAAQKGE